MNLKVYIGAVAIVMLGIGLWLGLSTVRNAEGFNCGSAFSPNDTSAYDAGAELGSALGGGGEVESQSATCGPALDSRLMPAVLLIVVGVLGSGALLWKPREPSSPSTPA